MEIIVNYYKKKLEFEQRSLDDTVSESTTYDIAEEEITDLISEFQQMEKNLIVKLPFIKEEDLWWRL